MRTIRKMRRWRGTIRGKSHEATIGKGSEDYQKQWDMAVMRRRMRYVGLWEGWEDEK